MIFTYKLSTLGGSIAQLVPAMVWTVSFADPAFPTGRLKL